MILQKRQGNLDVHCYTRFALTVWLFLKVTVDTMQKLMGMVKKLNTIPNQVLINLPIKMIDLLCGSLMSVLFFCYCYVINVGQKRRIIKHGYFCPLMTFESLFSDRVIIL